MRGTKTVSAVETLTVEVSGAGAAKAAGAGAGVRVEAATKRAAKVAPKTRLGVFEMGVCIVL